MPALFLSISMALISITIAPVYKRHHFWRDLGYALAALSAGLIADRFGIASAIIAIAGLTFVSGAVYGLAARPVSLPEGKA